MGSKCPVLALRIAVHAAQSFEPPGPPIKSTLVSLAHSQSKRHPGKHRRARSYVYHDGRSYWPVNVAALLRRNCGGAPVMTRSKRNFLALGYCHLHRFTFPKARWLNANTYHYSSTLTEIVPILLLLFLLLLPPPPTLP